MDTRASIQMLANIRDVDPILKFYGVNQNYFAL